MEGDCEFGEYLAFRACRGWVDGTIDEGATSRIVTALELIYILNRGFTVRLVGKSSNYSARVQ